MKIVHVEDAGDGTHRFSDPIQFNAAGKAFEQDIQRFVHDVPSGVDNEAAESDGENGIDIGPARVVDGDGTENNGAGANGIAHHVNESGAHIEITLLAAIQGEHDAAVNDERQECDPEHQLVIDGLRMDQTCDGFPENVKGNDDQGHCVNESGDNTGALITERFDLIGRAALEIETDGGEQKSNGVGKVMARVGEQRQTAGVNTGVDFKGGKT